MQIYIILQKAKSIYIIFLKNLYKRQMIEIKKLQFDNKVEIKKCF